MNCSWCGADVVKKTKAHKYCSTSCRVYAHNERKGKINYIEPTIKRKGINIGESVPIDRPSLPKIMETPQRGYIAAIEAEKKYWLNVYHQADAYTYGWTITLATLGLFSGKKEDTKILAGLGLGFLGYLIDKAGNEKKQLSANDVREHAIKQIKKLELKQKEADQLTEANNNKIRIYKDQGTTKITPIMTTDQYTSYDVQGYVFKDSEYGYFLGNPSKNFTMLLHGAPGSGKTTFSIKFADYFHRNIGKVLYIASEQKGIDYSLQKLIKKYNAKFNIHTDPRCVEDITKEAHNYKLIILDSVQSLNLSSEALREIKEAFKNTAFVFISQVNKDGAFKGSNSYLHDVDIEVKISDGVAELGKNRFTMHKEKFNIF